MATKKAERAATGKLPPLWDRLQSQIDWYDGKVTATSAPIRLRRSPLSFLPSPCRSLPSGGALAVGVAAGFILLLESLQHLNKWQENWILYRS